MAELPRQPISTVLAATARPRGGAPGPAHRPPASRASSHDGSTRSDRSSVISCKEAIADTRAYPGILRVRKSSVAGSGVAANPAASVRRRPAGRSARSAATSESNIFPHPHRAGTGPGVQRERRCCPPGSGARRRRADPGRCSESHHPPNECPTSAKRVMPSRCKVHTTRSACSPTEYPANGLLERPVREDPHDPLGAYEPCAPPVRPRACGRGRTLPGKPPPALSRRPAHREPDGPSHRRHFSARRRRTMRLQEPLKVAHKASLRFVRRLAQTPAIFRDSAPAPRTAAARKRVAGTRRSAWRLPENRPGPGEDRGDTTGVVGGGGDKTAVRCSVRIDWPW